MFIGHGLLAFAIAASVASRRGWTSDRALVVGVVAGLFATLPDVDMVYALVGLVVEAEGLPGAADAFWGAADVAHRGGTHSLVVGAVAAAGFAAWHARADRRFLAASAVLLGGLIATVAAVSGPVETALVIVFVLVGLAVTRAAASTNLTTRAVFAAASLGLLTHPFGDLLTGQPPALLYPIEVTLIADRITLHADPTLNLLGAFFVELSVLWLALLVVARLHGWRLRRLVRPRAALGIGYAGVAFAIPAPTLTLSWPFVFSVLAVGLIGVPLRGRRHTRWETIATALVAVTLAATAYTATYVLL